MFGSRHAVTAIMKDVVEANMSAGAVRQRQERQKIAEVRPLRTPLPRLVTKKLDHWLDPQSCLWQLSSSFWWDHTCSTAQGKNSAGMCIAPQNPQRSPALVYLRILALDSR